MDTAAVVQQIAQRLGLRRCGKVYYGLCPECGGSNKTDRFNIRPDGGYKCWSCGITGDIITWLRKYESMSCPDAHDHVGRACRQAATCPARENCRHGVKSGKPVTQRQRRNITRRPSKPYQVDNADLQKISRVEPEYPSEKWITWAEDFSHQAAERLLENSKELEYLNSRGIDRAAVERFGLGWIHHQYHIPKKSIGLGIEADNKMKLWVPEGLLIPIYDHGGALHRIRVRRPLEAREKFLQDLKYVWLKGSGNMPLVIRPEGKARGAVVVEAELDAFAIAAAHPGVLVVAVGTVLGGIDSALHAELQDVAVILVSLDAEANSKAAIDRWKATFRHARFWSTPEAKDAGDYFRAGGDLQQWIEKGLPPQVAPGKAQQPAKQDGAFSPAREQNRGEGEEKKISKQNPPEYIEITLSNGKVIYVVEQKGAVWDSLTQQNVPVFTRYELERLKAATAAMPKEEKIKAAMAAIEAKEVFGGYISRGESFGA